MASSFSGAAGGGNGGNQQQKKKSKPQKMNAFAMFMLEHRKEWENEGHSFPGGLRDVATFADPFWRELTEEQRDMYKEMAVAHNTGAAKKGGKPLVTTLGFRGPPAPENLMELTRQGVGAHHDLGFDIKNEKEGEPEAERPSTSESGRTDESGASSSAAEITTTTDEDRPGSTTTGTGKTGREEEEGELD